MHPLLNIEKLSEILGVAPITIEREIKRGRLQGTKIGRSWRFTQDAVEAYIKSRTIKKAA